MLFPTHHPRPVVPAAHSHFHTHSAFPLGLHTAHTTLTGFSPHTTFWGSFSSFKGLPTVFSLTPPVPGWGLPHTSHRWVCTTPLPHLGRATEISFSPQVRLPYSVISHLGFLPDFHYHPYQIDQAPDPGGRRNPHQAERRKIGVILHHYHTYTHTTPHTFPAPTLTPPLPPTYLCTYHCTTTPHPLHSLHHHHLLPHCTPPPHTPHTSSHYTPHHHTFSSTHTVPCPHTAHLPTFRFPPAPCGPTWVTATDLQVTYVYHLHLHCTCSPLSHLLTGFVYTFPGSFLGSPHLGWSAPATCLPATWIFPLPGNSWADSPPPICIPIRRFPYPSLGAGRLVHTPIPPLHHPIPWAFHSFPRPGGQWIPSWSPGSYCLHTTLPSPGFTPLTPWVPHCLPSCTPHHTTPPPLPTGY